MRPASGDEAPLVARGWDGYLLALDDARLARLETEGARGAWDDAPDALRALVEAVRAVTAIAPFPEESSSRAARRLETPRKRAQVDAFSALVARSIASSPNGVERIVDVGSGHGHLTRELAERLAVPVVGLERDPRLATRARDLASASGELSFAVTDVLRDGLGLGVGDCAVGLHACGELGDAIVEEVARAGASVALVGCCLQKRRATTRVALCEGPELTTRVLGLSNLTAREVGVEATRKENLAARERRLALHRLLEARIGRFRLGAEIDGLNRRTAHADLETLVARAFAVRALDAPSDEDIAAASAWARVHHARARRLSLPRSLLARVLEVFVLFDRAAHLEERGFSTACGTLFPDAISARNLALVARRG